MKYSDKEQLLRRWRRLSGVAATAATAATISAATAAGAINIPRKDSNVGNGSTIVVDCKLHLQCQLVYSTEMFLGVDGSLGSNISEIIINYLCVCVCKVGLIFA